jgi:Trk-type K+ transport system membrane component
MAHMKNQQIFIIFHSIIFPINIKINSQHKIYINIKQLKKIFQDQELVWTVTLILGDSCEIKINVFHGRKRDDKEDACRGR